MDDHNHETTPVRTLQELLSDQDVDDDGFSSAILEAVDLSLPDTYLQEILAQELLDYLAAYHRTHIGWKSARASGNQQVSEQMFRERSRFLTSIAYLQSKFPNLKPLADSIAKARATEAQRVRSALLRD